MAVKNVEYVGAVATLKHHDLQWLSAKSVSQKVEKQNELMKNLVGEFGWGGTSARKQRRCPKVRSFRTETFC
jgi:hypothetical protein